MRLRVGNSGVLGKITDFENCFTLLSVEMFRQMLVMTDSLAHFKKDTIVQWLQLQMGIFTIIFKSMLTVKLLIS